MDPTSARPGPAETEDDRRWAEALARVEQAPTSSAGPRPASRLLTWSWALASTVLVLAGAVFLVVLSTDTVAPDPGPSGGWAGGGLLVQGAGLAVMLGYGVIAWRTGLLRAVWSQPTAVLSRGQRRSLLAQVRGRAAVDPVRLPLARDVAWRLALQRHQLLLLVGIVVQQLGRAIGEPTRSTLGVTALAAVVLLGVGAWTHREARRAERFLADHPDLGSRD